MTFVEEFPSLKFILTTETDDKIEFIPLAQVEKHCLDKQKVKDIIFKYVRSIELQIKIKKELGLM